MSDASCCARRLAEIRRLESKLKCLEAVRTGKDGGSAMTDERLMELIVTWQNYLEGEGEPSDADVKDTVDALVELQSRRK
jgi:hypothetical protein